MTVRIHPTAIVEDGVEIGDGSSVWDNAHIRGPARIGRDCIVGGKSYIAYGVTIGDRVKINSFAYIPTGVSIGDGVMISAGAILTNDRFPRAASPDLSELNGSGPDEATEHTYIHDGATLGAGCRIGPGLEIGTFAMVGMGAVVTKSVAPFTLVHGTPAQIAGAVCRCGNVTYRGDTAACKAVDVRCDCGRSYRIDAGDVRELETADAG